VELGLLIGLLAGWILVGVLARAAWVQRRELRTVRRAIRGPEDVPVDVALERRIADLEDEVARAESVQHWLRGALDEARDAIVVVDRIGREVFRNAAGLQLVGAQPGSVLTQDALDDVLAGARAGRTTERELQLFGPPRRVLQVRAVPLRALGHEVVGAVAFATDVSEARRVEHVRRDFVANVSHELKTPIGALAVLAETMAASDDLAVMQQLAERVTREADRLGRIVDDLLDLSLIEAQEAPSREPVPVAVLVTEAVELVQGAADAAQVPVRVQPTPPDVEVVCDRRQLRSALRNLLDNAIKYSRPGDMVEIGARVDADRVLVEVRDRGIGIPTRDLERIFERFYRVDRARSRDTGGTGLGLAIVRHVAQAHGGEISVQSREGEGSMFTLALPVTNGSRRPRMEGS
jgi:two-component system sensor histidine kinase SenX3